MCLIIGTMVKAQEEAFIKSNCLICHYSTLRLFSLQRWLTFFFIPIARPWDKIYYIGCLNCQQCYKLKSRANVPMLLEEKFEGNLLAIIKTSKVDIL